MNIIKTIYIYMENRSFYCILYVDKSGNKTITIKRRKFNVKQVRMK